MDKKQIFILDDHPVMRLGLRQLILAEEDLFICGEAGVAREAMESLAANHPDLLLIDLSLPDKNGLEVIKDIIAMHGKLPMLVVSMHDESVYAERVLRAGAKGYIMKEAAADHLVHAIRRVLSGGVYVSERMASILLGALSAGKRESGDQGVSALSDREFEVFQLIGQGMGSRAIAEKLGISVRTIDSHRARIKEKLRLRDGNALTKAAVCWVQSH